MIKIPPLPPLFYPCGKKSCPPMGNRLSVCDRFSQYLCSSVPHGNFHGYLIPQGINSLFVTDFPNIYCHQCLMEISMDT